MTGDRHPNQGRHQLPLISKRGPNVAKSKSEPSDKGIRVLVIHSAKRTPDEAALRKLLRDAGYKVALLVLATPADVAAGKVDPSDFDHVIALLDDALAQDKHLEGGMLAVARCGQGVVGVWTSDEVSEDMHPSVQKYGKCQVPWDPAAVSNALEAAGPRPFQSTTGGGAASHGVRPNKC